VFRRGWARRWVGQYVTLARLTALEAIRQPVCILLTMSAVLLTGLAPLLTMHSLGEDGRLARDSALALHFFFGLFVAGYAASVSLAGEMRRGTAAAVLSKPIGRELFFLAKFTGVACVVIAFSVAAALATLLAERVAEHFVVREGLVGYVTDWQTGWLLLAAPCAASAVAAALNYRSGRPFGSTAFALLLGALVLVLLASGCFDRTGAWAPYELQVEWRMLPVALLLTLALLVLAAIALTLSTFCGPVPTVTLCVVLFLSGLMSDYLFGRLALSSWGARLLYHVVPNWQHFWMADALRAGGTVPWPYVGAAAAYGLVYLLGVLGVGLTLFRSSEVC
jgi:ABC-type transport system involved in multi-copper enzyme maturation permease subunit